MTKIVPAVAVALWGPRMNPAGFFLLFYWLIFDTTGSFNNGIFLAGFVVCLYNIDDLLQLTGVIMSGFNNKSQYYRLPFAPVVPQ